jgi:uroporphyrinogen-III decarboxylase
VKIADNYGAFIVFSSTLLRRKGFAREISFAEGSNQPSKKKNLKVNKTVNQILPLSQMTMDLSDADRITHGKAVTALPHSLLLLSF